MSDIETKFFAAELGGDVPELDLHGMFPEESLDILDQFLYRNFQEGRDTVKIIYGGGKGVLQKTVLDFLGRHPLVLEVKPLIGHCLAIISKKEV